MYKVYRCTHNVYVFHVWVWVRNVTEVCMYLYWVFICECVCLGVCLGVCSCVFMSFHVCMCIHEFMYVFVHGLFSSSFCQSGFFGHIFCICFCSCLHNCFSVSISSFFINTQVSNTKKEEKVSCIHYYQIQRTNIKILNTELHSCYFCPHNLTYRTI